MPTFPTMPQGEAVRVITMLATVLLAVLLPTPASARAARDGELIVPSVTLHSYSAVDQTITVPQRQQVTISVYWQIASAVSVNSIGATCRAGQSGVFTCTGSEQFPVTSINLRWHVTGELGLTGTWDVVASADDLTATGTITMAKVSDVTISSVSVANGETYSTLGITVQNLSRDSTSLTVHFQGLLDGVQTSTTGCTGLGNAITCPTYDAAYNVAAQSSATKSIVLYPACATGSSFTVTVTTSSTDPDMSNNSYTVAAPVYPGDPCSPLRAGGLDWWSTSGGGSSGGGSGTSGGGTSGGGSATSGGPDAAGSTGALASPAPTASISASPVSASPGSTAGPATNMPLAQDGADDGHSLGWGTVAIFAAALALAGLAAMAARWLRRRHPTA